MARYEYDQEHGEGAYDRATAGKNVDLIENAGRDLFNSSKALVGEGRQNWENATTDLSDTGKFIAEVGKSGADMVFDMIDNMILPGSGTAARTLRAAGAGAEIQSDRGNNDIDTRAAKAVFDGATEFLGMKLLGGVSSVYGKSAIGKAMDAAFKNLPSGTQSVLKTVLNTEGFEEGVESAIGWLGDRILGFDQDASISMDDVRKEWPQTKQEMAVGYILGVLFNGVAGGISYSGKDIQRVVDESIEAANSGLTPQEIVDVAMSQPNEDVKIEAGKQKAEPANTPASENEAGRMEDTAESEQAPQQTSAQQDVIDILMNPTGENGMLSNRQVRIITSDPALLQAFQEVTGTTPDTSTNSNTRNTVKEAAAQFKADEDLRTEARSKAEQRAEIDNIIDEVRGWEVDDEQTQNGNGLVVAEAEELGIDPRILIEQGPDARTSKGENSVARTLANSISSIEHMQHVAELTGKEMNDRSKKPSEQITAFFKRIGNVVRRANFGDVILDQYGVDGVINHKPLNRAKMVTLEAVPSVIQNGEVIGYDENWKGRGYASYIFAAPVKINGKTVYVAAVVNKVNGNQFYLNECVDSEGHYIRINEGPSDNAKTGFTAADGITGGPEEPSATTADANAETAEAQNSAVLTVPQNPESVNTDGAESGQNPQGAGEPQNAPQSNPNPQGADIPPAGQESDTDGLTGSETKTETTAPQEGAKTAPGTGKEKVSQFFTNTLTKREGDSVGDPLTYLTKSEAETLQNAVNRLNMNGDAEMGTMLATTMWNDEQVKMAKVIGSALFNDSEASGDKTAYNAWRKIEREHATAIARALRAYGNDPDTDVNAESIARMVERYLSLVEDGAVPEVGNLKPEQIQAARTQSEEATSALAKLEAAEKQHLDSGMSAEEAFEKVKEDYLNLAQKLVAQRNVGLLRDNIFGRNKALRNGVEGVTTSLKKLLAKQDADYIRRYVQSNTAALTGDLKYQAGVTANGVGKWLNSMQKLCQLFGSGTTLRNTEGNVLFGTLDFLSNDVAGVAADSFLSLITGNRTRGMETGVLGGKNWGASRTAVEQSILEIAANMDMSEDGKYIGSGQSAFNPYRIGGRFLQRANQILSYALNTTDAAAVGMTQQSAADAAQRANRHSGGNMTEETAERIGKQEAEYRTFKNETTPQKVLEFIRDALDLIGVGGEKTKLGGVTVGRKGGFGAGTLIAPYIGVPVNIAVKGAEYSPIGAAIGVKNAFEAAKMAKGEGPNSKAMQDSMVLQNKAAGQIGRGVIGTALTVLLAGLMKQAKEEDKEWFKNWNLETDPDVKAQNKAEGKSGLQINLSMLMSLLLDDERSRKCGLSLKDAGISLNGGLA